MELLLPLVCLCLLSCSGDAVRVVVEDGSDAVLPCSPSTKVDLRRKAIDWKKDRQDVLFNDPAGHRPEGAKFIGRVSFFEDELKDGNASIKITKTKMADSGTYSCIFPNVQTFKIELVVGQVLKDRTGENIPGAAPEPNIRTLDVTNEWAMLQCEAHGLPPLTVEWKDSAGNTLPAEEPQISERGGLSYVTVNVTVTKTDNYRCVATQVEISHQIPAATYVRLTGAASELSVTTLKTDDETILQCVVKGASPKPKVEWKDSSGNILPVKDLKETERGDSYDIVLQAAVTRTDRYRCVVTQEEINHHIYAESYANINGSNTGAIVGGVFIALFVGFVSGALVVFFCKKQNPGRDPGSSETPNPPANGPTETEATHLNRVPY